MKQRLHLVRPGAAVAGGSPGGASLLAGARPEALAERDWVVYLDPLELTPHGTPPLPPGPLDHDQLVALTFAADLVITW